MVSHSDGEPMVARSDGNVSWDHSVVTSDFHEEEEDDFNASAGPNK